jgi:hypothetical protein
MDSGSLDDHPRKEQSHAERSLMSDDPAREGGTTSPEMLRGMTGAVGVNLTGDRAETLAPQAEQHFAQLRYLDSIAKPSTEPAAELRLDRWARPASD